MNKKNFEQLSLKLERNKILLGYWRDAEKNEIFAFTFLFGVVIIPSILKVNLSFKDPFFIAVLVIIFIFLVMNIRRRNFYIKKLKEVRERIEKLKL